MNSGCYGNEISNILISINALDFKGNLFEIKRKDIKFNYRGSSLPEDLIFLSAKLQATKGDKNLIKEKVEKYLKEKKSLNQVKLKHVEALLKIKDKKAWELIKNSNCDLASFGKASISKKHCNFFVNEVERHQTI